MNDHTYTQALRYVSLAAYITALIILILSAVLQWTR